MTDLAICYFCGRAKDRHESRSLTWWEPGTGKFCLGYASIEAVNRLQAKEGLPLFRGPREVM